MHDWADDTFDWKGLNEAVDFIDANLRRFGHIAVRQSKEKFGTVRVYCSLGFNQLHDITHPGYCCSRYPKWLWDLDCIYGSKLIPFLFNWWIVPYQKFVYRKVYQEACKKWPHLEEEICCCADFRELLTFYNPWDLRKKEK